MAAISAIVALTIGCSAAEPMEAPETWQITVQYQTGQGRNGEERTCVRSDGSEVTAQSIAIALSDSGQETSTTKLGPPEYVWDAEGLPPLCVFYLTFAEFPKQRQVGMEVEGRTYWRFTEPHEPTLVRSSNARPDFYYTALDLSQDTVP